MLVGDKYKIEADSLNIILFERKAITGTNRNIAKRSKRTVGEIFWKPTNYFSSIKEALHHIVEYEVKSTELKDLETVCKKVEELHGIISKLPFDSCRQLGKPLVESIKGIIPPPIKRGCGRPRTIK